MANLRCGAGGKRRDGGGRRGAAAVVGRPTVVSHHSVSQAYNQLRGPVSVHITDDQVGSSSSNNPPIIIRFCSLRMAACCTPCAPPQHHTESARSYKLLYLHNRDGIYQPVLLYVLFLLTIITTVQNCIPKLKLKIRFARLHFFSFQLILKQLVYEKVIFCIQTLATVEVFEEIFTTKWVVICFFGTILHSRWVPSVRNI